MDIKAECPEEKTGEYLCPNCKQKTEHKIYAVVNRYDEDLYNDVTVQFWNDYHTVQCIGCKTISFCKISLCSEEFDFDHNGHRCNTSHIETYPHVIESEQAVENVFVDPIRINDIKNASSEKYDTKKLLQILFELNCAYDNHSYISCILLVRSLMDHVPPIFAKKNFPEIANNYSGAGRSFKDAMLHLENSCRKIADMHLHSQIKEREMLPSSAQVEFRADLDLLLTEVVKLLSQ